MIFRIAETDVFIVGSIHLLPSGVTLSLEKQRALVEQSSEVIFESDLDHITIPTSRLLQSGRLSDILAKDIYDRVAALTAQIGFEEQIDTVKPWFMGLALSIRLQIKSGAGFGGVDRALWDQAKAAGKLIFVLEQAEIFEKIDAAPISEAVAVLEYVATHPDEPVTQLRTIYEAWQATDQEALDAAFLRMSRIAPTIYQCLFEDRNRLWMPSLLTAINGKRQALFVVGCGHIAHGSASIKRLLEEAGFSLEAVG